MSAVDILFDPIVKQKPVETTKTGIVRRAESISAEIRMTNDRSLYINAAIDVMNKVVANHAMTNLIDVRQVKGAPYGALDLTEVVNRYYDGDEELWVACPSHMPPDLIRFLGRFGYRKIVQMPKNHGDFNFVYWSFLDTNAGILPGIDLGVVLVPVEDRWYRIFTNKTDARSYYQS